MLLTKFLPPCCTCPAGASHGKGKYKACLVRLAEGGKHRDRWVAGCSDRKCGYYGEQSNCMDMGAII